MVKYLAFIYVEKEVSERTYVGVDYLLREDKCRGDVFSLGVATMPISLLKTLFRGEVKLLRTALVAEVIPVEAVKTAVTLLSPSIVMVIEVAVPDASPSQWAKL